MTAREETPESTSVNPTLPLLFHSWENRLRLVKTWASVKGVFLVPRVTPLLFPWDKNNSVLSEPLLCARQGTKEAC